MFDYERDDIGDSRLRRGMTDIARSLYRRLPLDLRHAILVRRRAAIWRQAGIVFVHIPKAAGTSINQTLYGRFMGHPPAVTIRRWAPRDVVHLPSFAVTRNPWARVVSAYRFAKTGAGLGTGLVAGMRRPDQYRTNEFATFERFVQEWLAQRNILAADGVFQPQWRFVCDTNRTVLVDHLGKVEDLSSTYEFILDTVGAEVRFPHANLSGPSVDYRDYYDSSTRRTVATIYEEDIRLFGYDF